MRADVMAKLEEMGLSLPPYRGARGDFLPWRRDGNLVFLAGQTCDWGAEVTHRGPVLAPGQTPPAAGPHVTIAEGRKAAKICALNLLYHLQDACEGDLDRVRTVMRLGGFVNCLHGFDSSPEVINGASELLIALYGENGRHARTAVGVSGLPANASVEVDAIVLIE